MQRRQSDASNDSGPTKFRDSTGIEWEVREIEPPELTTASGSGLAFGEFGHGWLLFTAANGSKRRLAAPYPAHWRGLRAADLEAWCRRAKAATPISDAMIADARL